MLERRIRGVPALWLVVGTIVVIVGLGVFALGGYIVYSSAVSTSAANVSAVEKALGAKITAQEQALLAKFNADNNALALRIDKQEREAAALRGDLIKANDQIAGLKIERTRLHTEVLLLKALGKVRQASIHLSDDSPGSAQRDLAVAIDVLDQAKTLVTEGKKVTVEEVRKGLAELRQSIEAKAYPIATLEILGDKLEDLIGK